MIISCKCLNISIVAKTPDLQDVSNLELTDLEQNDPLFKENKLCTVDLVRISKEQASLVHVRNVGNWIIHRCLNCSMNTHAIHRERGAACVLVSRAMLTNLTDISNLKASDKYSTVFRIIINHSDNDLTAAQTPTKFSVSQLPGPVQTALSAIQQQLGEAIQQEVARTEEKIRIYSEQQHAALEEFRENAHNDHRVLVRLLCEAQESLVEPEKPVRPITSNESKPPQTSTFIPHLPYSVGASIPNSPTARSGNISSSRKQQPIADQSPAAKMVRTSSATSFNNGGDGPNKTERRVKSQLFSKVSTQGSLDTEGLFDLDGMDDNPGEVFHSEDETDTDDSGSNDEGIHMSRDRGGNFNMAKSLPMNVPTFFSAHMRGGDDSGDERIRPEGPTDIAASIKALAKSVHGDANVFGDLPQPRFSTQI